MAKSDSRTIRKVVVTQEAKDKVILGDECIAVGGPDTFVKAGEHGVAVVKGHGHAETVECGVAVLFGRGHAVGGAQCISIAGIAAYSDSVLPPCAEAGDGGVVVVGNGGYARVGNAGVIIIFAHVGPNNELVPFVGQTAPGGTLLARQWYHLNYSHRFEPVPKPPTEGD